jgi:hypothetical protein
MGITRRSLVVASLYAGFFGVLYGVAVCAAGAQSPLPIPKTPQELLLAVARNENAAADKAEHYEYLSNERSGRTGGHLWTERVIETGPGRMRLLIAEDGRPLSPERQQAERARLQRIAQHPEEFIKKEQNTRVEEKRARDLLEVLPKDFLFENVQLKNGVWSLGFRPNPDYAPSGVEERVLHAMAGTLVIDQREERLLHMDFHMVHDVPIGFGLADVRMGTNFESDRQLLEGHWHTTHIATEVRAKAIFFKNLDLNVVLTRSDFRLLDHNVSVQEAAQLLLR